MEVGKGFKGTREEGRRVKKGENRLKFGCDREGKGRKRIWGKEKEMRKRM